MVITILTKLNAYYEYHIPIRNSEFRLTNVEQNSLGNINNKETVCNKLTKGIVINIE